MRQMNFHVLIVLLYTIPIFLIQGKHVPRGSKVLLDDLIKVRHREKRDTPTIVMSIDGDTTNTPTTNTSTTTNTTSSTTNSPTKTTITTTGTIPRSPTTKTTNPTTKTTSLTKSPTSRPTTKTASTTTKTTTTTTSTIPTITDTVWQYKAPYNGTQTKLQHLTNEIPMCMVKDYPYGWGLKAGQTGCCGNYPGCCKFASIFCWFHDIACTCCGSILCGPQCQNDLSCDQMLSDSAVDEGSGEI